MIRNYLKTAFRFLMRNKSYTFINVLGLSIGIACCLTILMFVQKELGYDNFHKDGDRIYRMALERVYPERVSNYAIIPAGFSEVIANDFPEVEATTRLLKFPGSIILKIDETIYEEEERMWADSNFFSMFSIPLLEGDPNEALKTPNAVVLTQSTARKYFGEENAMGKVIDIPQNDNDLIVTGISADVPDNSHFNYDLLMSSKRLNFLQQPNYISFSAYTYLRLSPNVTPATVEAKFPDLVTKYASGQVNRNFGVSYEEYVKNGNGYNYTLTALPDIYLHSNLEGELKAPGSATRVYIFTIIAFFILFIACINFMNLATARSAERAKEVGIRKTLGSERSSIAFQFLAEAVLITFISGIIAWGILQFMVPLFNNLTGKVISISQLFQWQYLPLFLLFPVLIGLLAGAYPAVVLSGYQPLEVLKGKFGSTQKGAFLRNALVVLQFSISVVLIISTITVFRQMSFIQNKSLGFDKENIISLQRAFNLTAQQTESFKNQINNLAGVDAVAGCNAMPGGYFFGASFRPQGENEMVTGRGLIVDEDYAECMKLELVDGRDYAKEFTADTASVIINEAAVRELGLVDPIGKRLSTNDTFGQNNEGEKTFTIVGVVKDFHFQSLHQDITPIFFIHHGISQGVSPLLSIRLNGTNTQGTINEIEKAWATLLPDVPFNFSFLDSDLNQMYQAEQTSKRVFGLFSMLAIFIACMGLLGLAAYVTQRRTKEIGVRKVLGATTGNIITLLSKDFLKLVVIALLVACPIAWFAMRSWLQDFAYAINLSWWIFALAGLLAMGIAFATVSFQSVRAAVANPIKSLRDE